MASTSAIPNFVYFVPAAPRRQMGHGMAEGTTAGPLINAAGKAKVRKDTGPQGRIATRSRQLSMSLGMRADVLAT